MIGSLGRHDDWAGVRAVVAGFGVIDIARQSPDQHHVSMLRV